MDQNYAKAYMNERLREAEHHRLVASLESASKEGSLPRKLAARASEVFRPRPVAAPAIVPCVSDIECCAA